MSDLERERFEAWYSTKYEVTDKKFCFHIGENGEYRNQLIEKQFVAWQSAKQDGIEWVKVIDKLPPFDIPVFAGYFRDGNFHYGQYVAVNYTDGWVWSRVYSDDEWFEDDDYSYLTHWQPMPQPPREQS